MDGDRQLNFYYRSPGGIMDRFIMDRTQSAVPKKSKDRLHDITDAREGNKCLDE